MQAKRTIAVVTTSRADYSHLFYPLKAMMEEPALEPALIVMGPHLSPEFGFTAGEIEADGIPIYARIECLLSSDSDTGMAKTIGLATLSLADCLSGLRPDLILLIADRYEMLAPAAVALALRIPIAHIEGGEISEGAIDDAVRNAITKMSHLHFTPTEKARQRVIAMGEEPWRVTRTGAPSLDHLRCTPLPSRDQLAQLLGLNWQRPKLLLSFHPVTLDKVTTYEADALFLALEDLHHQLLFCFPNTDAGSRLLIRRAQDFVGPRQGRVFVNLPARHYWALLHHVDALIGNSSSGIMETPSLKLPTVNVGKRQQGREQAANIISVPAEAQAIAAAIDHALSTTFRQSLSGLINPYGDGHAAERIVRHLCEAPLGDRLLIKRAVPLPDLGR